MMSRLPQHKNFAVSSEVTTRTYRGPDRRDPNAKDLDPEIDISRDVHFDDKGNPVMSVRTNVPRRREGDKTIDLIKCLDIDSIELESDD